MRTRCSVLACLATLGVSIVAPAADWTQFRGADHTGVADAKLQWKVKIPGVAWSSPIANATRDTPRSDPRDK